MMGMLDLHTHILPGMDDGSRDVQQSVEMLRAEADQGVGRVVLTPHFYPRRESPADFLFRRDQSMQWLKDGLRGQKDLPHLYAGAEVAYYDSICRTDEITRMCIGRSGALLVEMPFVPWTQRMLGELFELRSQRRIQPIIAHIDRYLPFLTREILFQLYDSGLWIQANTSFFLEWRTSRKAMQMLDEGHIHFIGSDCHNMDKRSPNMGKAAEKIIRKLGAQGMRFLEDMEDMLLGG